MEIQYNLTEDDYLQFNLFHLRNSQAAVKTMNIQRFVIPVFYIVIAYFFAKMTDGSYVLAFSIFGSLALIWAILYPKYYYRSVLRHVKKMFKEGKNDGLLGEHRMTLTDDGIVDVNAKGETKVAWSGIQEYKEDEQFIYLYNSSVSAYIIPKRDLRNLNEIRETLRTKLEK